MSKEEIKLKEKQLLEMVESFSSDYLDEEYEALGEKLVKKMARKHDVPFKRGKLEIWASAVIYALGQINFLFDESFEPYSSPDEICDYFNTKKSTVVSKARKIREMFNMGHYDKEFSTKMMEDNSIVELENGLLAPKSFVERGLGLTEDVTLLSLMIEKTGESEEEIIEYIKNDFKDIHGENDSKMFLEIIKEPMPLELAEEILSNSFENDFNGEDKTINTIEDYQKDIDHFKDTKGIEYFKENEGYFWDIPETRPFMMDLFMQAILLWEKGKKEESINQLKYLLELNPDDNQGVRYILINYLLELNRLEEAADLLDYFDEEYSANWNYSKLLLAIKSDKEDIKDLYQEAIDANEYVIPYLLGEKQVPSEKVELYGVGDEDEAIYYLETGLKSWLDDKKAIKTLKELVK